MTTNQEPTMQNQFRKPRPKKMPSTLRELVLDLDERLVGGDPLSDVWLPHEEWTALAEFAQEEAEDDAEVARLEAQQPPSAARELVLEAALERWRGDIARALGAGVDTELADLVEIAKGYAMALDLERDRYVQRVAELGNRLVAAEVDREAEQLEAVVKLAAQQARASRATRIAQSEPEHATCPHCGEADGHRPEDCAMLEEAPTMVESVEREREESCARRLNGQGWKRSAKQAREANALDACHHCGVGETDVDGRDLMVSRHDTTLPDGVFCGPCRKRLTANPREWDRHSEPTTKSPRKPRGFKKFPKGAAEPCTACGEVFNAHDGLKCPPKQRGLPVSAEDAPF